MIRKMTFVLPVLIATTTGVLAHSKLEQTTSGNEATVAAVDATAMRFDDPMRVTEIMLIGPDGDVSTEQGTRMDTVTQFRALQPADLHAVD